MTTLEVQVKLFENIDEKFKEFHSSLVPNLDKDTIIGVRTPILRELAKEIARDDAKEFLENLPHKYYEENNVHAFVIALIKDFDKCIKEIDKFLPYVDNWATCDGLRPKVFAKNKDKLLAKIKEWIKSDKVYTIRFAIEMLMVHFLDDDFDPKNHTLVLEVTNQDYYVKMMKAWYFATALAKQYDKSVFVLEEKLLGIWTHNKTIRKCVESFRVTEKNKQYLKTLAIKVSQNPS